MTFDDDQSGKPSKKPGFLRRLFGGGRPDDDAVPVAQDDAARALTAQREIDALHEAGVVDQPETPHDTDAVDHPIAPAPQSLLPSVSTLLDPDAPAPELTAAEPIDASDVDDDLLSDGVEAEPLSTLLGDDDAIEQPAPEAARPSWWRRLTTGLARSSSSITQGIVDIFAKRKLDATMLEDLDDILIRADLGVAMATRITDAVGKGRYDKTIDPDEVRQVLADEVEATLAPVAVPLDIEVARKPFTILMIGVNGSGKTTTIGKLAAKFTGSGKSVMLAAGDTFRAAAVEQLKVWGARTGSTVVSRPQGADAAGLAFDAVTQAREAGTDVLLIDTAGRLQNRTELMEELAKVLRVIRKLDADAPHAVLLVLDATVGQNALSQVEIFSRVAGVTGLVMTKLDGTARGGILVAIAEKFRLPIHFIGVGEGVDDLEPFAARDFARAIAGLDDDHG
ncbi:signal recognition particle-docking protein FtsY [Lichenihabitans sp. PAMC28606]|uniref:signal recognition particle-docking protein FtsY n=1 Tax=Lichenihabitans sp. PAMC28606 TaxID=2880932 RepID=UPI001D0A1B8C|nr:signal recognition particle-docking protein FtsY [Lichenihabitans sp. PAMC28606]UDL93182.1 signal recognition particle-docking protein FtsY [Lichenihabitans sp. PAMC28606]